MLVYWEALKFKKDHDQRNWVCLLKQIVALGHSKILSKNSNNKLLNRDDKNNKGFIVLPQDSHTKCISLPKMWNNVMIIICWARIAKMQKDPTNSNFWTIVAMVKHSRLRNVLRNAQIILLNKNYMTKYNEFLNFRRALAWEYWPIPESKFGVEIALTSIMKNL
jgi:hypothetical protein